MRSVEVIEDELTPPAPTNLSFLATNRSGLMPITSLTGNAGVSSGPIAGAVIDP